MKHSEFIEGPFGVGKTTYAIEKLRQWRHAGTPGHRILVLLPQRTLGLAYQAAFSRPDWPDGSIIDIATLGGLARRGIDLFWPVIAQSGMFIKPAPEPTFLTLETSQYFMARFVREEIRTGIFDSLNLTPYAIMRQTLDNLSKAAVNRISLDEVAERLIAAWGSRHSSRPPVYRASLDVAKRFRQHCLEQSLLDFSLQIELFVEFLLSTPEFRAWFAERYSHLVADNLEENPPVVADFIRWAWDELDQALLLFDVEAGFRAFLGANPRSSYELKAQCNKQDVWSKPVQRSRAMQALTDEVSNLLYREAQNEEKSGPRSGSEENVFTYGAYRFYPEMIDWVVDQIKALVGNGTEPSQIMILAPFVSDSLWFALNSRLDHHQIPNALHRPSRALRSEPATRAILTLMALAHPFIRYQPPVADAVDAFQQAIDGLDPIRAWLLTQVVYHPARQDLGSFDVMQSSAQERITFAAGNRYEQLRRWLVDYAEEDASRTPPDHFVSRVFNEVLAQDGFGFRTDLDAGRVISELIESASKYRQVLFPDSHEVVDWSRVTSDYFDLLQEGLLPALYLTSWDLARHDAVTIAPAYTFVMRNVSVDYQFWLDVGSSSWWERLEQPLTHPYVLARDYDPRTIWTDDMEYDAREQALSRLVVGLIRRCNRRVYAAIANLGEQGFEQRGPLLMIVQRLATDFEFLE